MTRNRAAGEAPSGDGTTAGRRVGTLLTLVLLAPAASLLAARAHDLVLLQEPDSAGCSGLAVIGSVLRAGVPVVLLVLLVPAALLSLGHRARGWMWLAPALLATVALELALRVWLPPCG